jgi:ABC-type multidrug transport system ATPase subunit
VAVEGLSFDLGPGTATGFLGPNGSGKSTTMRLMLRPDSPDAGQGQVGGRRHRELRWPLHKVGCWRRRAAGRDPAEITCAYNLQIRLQSRPGSDPEVVSGPPDAVAERLLELARMGFSALNFIVAGPRDDEQTERIARDVIPAVRSATFP